MPQPGFSSLIQGQIFDIVKGMVARVMVTFLWRMDVKDGYSITDSFLYLMASWDHNVNQYCIVTCRAGSEKIPRFELDIAF